MSLPSKSKRHQLRGIKFEILNPQTPDLLALRMLIYNQSFKSALRWTIKNTNGFIKNLSAINPEEFSELYAEVDRKINEYTRLSNNSRKKILWSILKEAE